MAVFSGAQLVLWRSHVNLGRNWSPTMQIRNQQSLVDRGVYARIRHPMYTAHGLWGVGQMLLLHNWIAGPLFLVLFVPFCLYRVPREERMMIERFGDHYRDYVKRTGRYWPPWRVAKVKMEGE